MAFSKVSCDFLKLFIMCFKNSYVKKPRDGDNEGSFVQFSWLFFLSLELKISKEQGILTILLIKNNILWGIIKIMLEKIKKKKSGSEHLFFCDSDIVFWHFLIFCWLGCGCSVDIGTYVFFYRTQTLSCSSSNNGIRLKKDYWITLWKE